MTGWGVLAVVVVCGSGLWVYRSAGPALDRWVSRWLAVREGQARMTEERQAREFREAEKGRVQIPADLEAVILMESARFAQDEIRADILDRYAVFGDWNKVRTAVGVGHIDAAAS